MSEAYFYVNDGEQQGPCSAAEMCSLYQSAAINDGTFVWANGMENWMSISDSPLKDRIRAIEAKKKEPKAASVPQPKPTKPGKKRTESGIAPAPSAPSKCTLSYGRLTTKQLDLLGVQDKKGYLLKKSYGFFSRFQKKYFVLQGPVLSCYDTAEQYLCDSGGGKEMRLSIASAISYTDAKNTFIVRALEVAEDTESTWMLVAENTSDTYEWVAYLNAHINAIHQRVHGEEEERDHWKEGTIATSFWGLPCRNQYGPVKNPVGIRSSPDAQGPRTGEGVFPGEIVEVVQTIEKEGNTFLRLADDRGWVFRLHPVNLSELLCQLQAGEYYYVEKMKSYKVSPSQKRGVPIAFNPGEASRPTGQSLRRGEEVSVTAIWSLNGPSGEPGVATFLKLQDGRGWVMAVDEKGEEILEESSALNML